MTREERKIARSYEIAYRRLFVLFVVALIIAVTLTAMITSSIMSRPVLVQTSDAIVFVEEGDTIWDYAEKYCPENMDIRKYIDIVRDYNDKDNTNVYVGEVIRLPIFSANRY